MGLMEDYRREGSATDRQAERTGLANGDISEQSRARSAATCLSVDPGFAVAVRGNEPRELRRLGQKFNKDVPMTLGQSPCVGAVKAGQRLFIQGDHPSTIGRRYDPQVNCHAGSACNS